MRDFITRWLQWLAYAAVIVFLLLGGWRIVLGWIPGLSGRLPALRAVVSPLAGQSVSGELGQVFARYGVTMEGTAPQGRGTLVTLLWPRASVMAGENALNEARRRRIIRGYQVAAKPDLRNYGGRETVWAQYVIW